MTSKNSGVRNEEDREFDAYFRDENGKLNWDKIREYASRPEANWRPMGEVLEEFYQERLKKEAERKQQEADNGGHSKSDNDS